MRTLSEITYTYIMTYRELDMRFHSTLHDLKGFNTTVSIKHGLNIKGNITFQYYIANKLVSLHDNIKYVLRYILYSTHFSKDLFIYKSQGQNMTLSTNIIPRQHCELK